MFSNGLEKGIRHLGKTSPFRSAKTASKLNAILADLKVIEAHPSQRERGGRGLRIIKAVMSAHHSARCIFSRPTAPVRACLRRNFHTSRPFYVDPGKTPAKPPAADKKKKIGRLAAPKAKGIPGAEAYTEEEKEVLKRWYTPAQLAAVEAGEAAVDPEDLLTQGTLRNDPMAFNYIDDFAEIDPVVDKAVRAPKSNYDPKSRFKNPDEIAEDFGKFVRELPEKPTRLDYVKFRDNLRLTVGKEAAERNPISSLAPAIPKGVVDRPGVTKKPGEVDIDPAMKRLMRQTGYSRQEILQFKTKVLVQHGVVNQTRMGKIRSIYNLCIAGNGRGLLGIGEGKATEFADARTQAQYNAIRNARPIPRYEDRTIYGDVKVKMGAVEIELMTRPPGTYADEVFSSVLMCSQASVYGVSP